MRVATCLKGTVSLPKPSMLEEVSSTSKNKPSPREVIMRACCCSPRKRAATPASADQMRPDDRYVVIPLQRLRTCNSEPFRSKLEVDGRARRNSE